MPEKCDILFLQLMITDIAHGIQQCLTTKLDGYGMLLSNNVSQIAKHCNTITSFLAISYKSNESIVFHRSSRKINDNQHCDTKLILSVRRSCDSSL